MQALLLKEWRQLWREQRLPWMLAAGVLAAILSLANTVLANRAEHIESTHAAAAEYARWLAQGHKYAHAAAHYGMYAFRPVYGLANVDPGVSGYVGHAVWLEAHVQDSLVYRPFQDRASAERLGSFTPALLLGTLLPLALVIAGYGTIAGERDRGTLRLVLVHAQSLPKLMASKALPLFGIGAAASAVLLLGAALSSRFSGMAEPADAMLRWTLLLGLYLLSAAFWSMLVVACSAVCRTAGQALALLLTLWVAFGLMLPRAITDYAARRAPTPTQLQVATLIRAAVGEADSGDREEETRQRLLRQYRVTRVEDLPVNWDGIYREEGEQHGDVIFDRFWGQLFAQYVKQEHTVAALAWVSPTLATGWLAERLTATDMSSHLGYVHAAEEHRRLIQHTMNTELSRKRNDPSPRPLSGPELWRSVPAFSYQAPALGSDAAPDPFFPRLVAAELLSMAALALALLIFAARRLRSANA